MFSRFAQTASVSVDYPARHSLRGQKDNTPYWRIVKPARERGNKINTRLAKSPLPAEAPRGEGMARAESVIEMGTLSFGRLVSSERGI
jgi:hypothetical protein